MSAPRVTVTDNTDDQRYEIRLDGELAGFAERPRAQWSGGRPSTCSKVDPADLVVSA